MSGFTILGNYKKEAVLSGFDQKIHCLVRFQAPDTPADLPERPALNLAIVLDRSGSMSGQPLEEAKRCACQIIERLETKDKASVVVYDNRVNVIVPTTPVTDKEKFRLRIASIRAGGSTNLAGGWEAGADQLIEHRTENSISRVLLLSDGCANVGLQDPVEIAKLCTQFADKGISTSTYGLGHNFNEHLMIQMAEAGNGNGYYGETAQDLEDPFIEEFELLNAICGTEIRLTLQPEEGITIKVLNTLVCTDSEYKLSDIAYDGEVWALLEITLPKELSGVGIGDKVDLGAVHMNVKDVEGQRHEHRLDIALPSLNAAAFEVVKTDELVDSRLAEIEAANIQLEASEAALRGDWSRVDALLQKARQNAGNNIWLQNVVTALEDLARGRSEMEFTKEVYYSSRRMNKRMTLKNERRSRNEDHELPSFFRKKSRQGKGDPKRRGS